jgi:hypothetical protein
MESLQPGNGGSGGDERKEDDWWKQFEDKKKKKFENQEKYPIFANPVELFSTRNAMAVFIRAPGKKASFRYGGAHLKALRDLINAYDIVFKNGDQYLENTDKTVEEIRRTPIGKLALARDALMAFLFSIYQNEKEEWEMLRVSGFLEIMIAVAQGETCNNILSKELRKCLSGS